jgi:hypothetical protein
MLGKSPIQNSVVEIGDLGLDSLVHGGNRKTWLNMRAFGDHLAGNGHFDSYSAGKAMFPLLGTILVQSIGYFFLVYGFFPLLALGSILYVITRIGLRHSF